MRGHAKAPTAAPTLATGRLIALLALATTAFLAIAAAPALAAPTVSIDPPVPHYTSIEVSGSVDPGAADAEIYAEYATDPAGPWTYAPFQTIAAGSGPTPVATEITGLKPATEYFLRLDAYSEGVETYSPQPYPSATTLAVAPPSATIDPVSPTATSAHFEGEINPGGSDPAFDTSWRFQCLPECPGLSGGLIPAEDSAHTVQADTSGLLPGTAYEVTLVAENAGGQATGGPEAFTTATTPPQIHSTQAAAGAREAALEASLNPGGLQTTYRFDWGPTAAYGHSTATKTLAASGKDASFSVGLLGLSPGTTYHYRLVATNSDDSVEGPDQSFMTQAAASPEACPNAAIRQQQNSTYLPDCRAYEQVSPVDKNGYPVYFAPQTSVGVTRAAHDGDSVVFNSWGTFAGSNSGMPTTYLSRRTPAGWATRAASPPPKTSAPTALGGISTWRFSTPDLAVGVLTEDNDFFDPTDVNETSDVYTQALGATPVLASRGNGAERVERGVGVNYAGISTDGGTVGYETSAHLTPEDSARLAFRDLYVRSGDRTEMVNVSPGGDLVNQCGSKLGSGPSGGTTRNAISSDGSQVVFQAPFALEFGIPDCEAADQVYVHVAGAGALHASGSQRTDCADHDPCAGTPEPDPAGTRPAAYLDASADGSDVFFSSEEMLTDDAPVGGGLYEFHPADSSLEYIDGTVQMVGVIRVSDDGSHVFFAANGEINGEGGPGQNVYVYVNGAIHWLATDLSGSAALQEGPASREEASKSVYLTPDGRNLVFVTKAQLTDYNNAGCFEPLQGIARNCQEVYLYSEGTPGVTCISCDPAGQRPAGSKPDSDAGIGTNTFNGGAQEMVLSNDGSVVFFTTADQLISADTNRHRDVYQYSNGRVELISSGKSSEENFLIGSSADGRAVFFSSIDKLAPGDVDDNQDVYVARVDGGFVESNTATSTCLGESCQGSAGMPATPAAGTEAFSGPANPVAKKPKKARKHQAKHHRKAKKRKHHKRGRRSHRAGSNRGGVK